MIRSRPRAQRAAAAFGHILALAQCEQGRLYLLTEAGLTFVAGAPDSPELHAVALRWHGLDDDDSSDEHTITGEHDDATTLREQGPVRPVLLSCERREGLATVGVVALSADQSNASNQVMRLARELSHAFIDFGDAEPRFRTHVGLLG